MKYILIFSTALLMVGCSTWQPATDEQYRQNMHDLDMYMLEHGMQPPDRL